tara:strand:- start:186 stop:359 length:174 start_codon:yes stop_codon:yes gene_type:complete
MEMITEKEMMKCIDDIGERLILTRGEGQMPFLDFITWVKGSIVDWYDNYKEFERDEE